MFGSIGISEILIILLIALLIFGPRKLPELGKSLGRALFEFKKTSNEFQKTLRDLNKEIEEEAAEEENKKENTDNSGTSLQG
ncbi:MAG: hypothetical protein A2Y62_05125 [Candidatus Fischerbacteria bacterium RBG_13_37_8]|uniref:Sec-independent protein translocase protein TatA n=1 Tax=Candidatus Fischerbacteria bacterium RBG_13_37_8 TaxID=1817863 RepID=A0A1F5V8I2_9BACT|nr:MAG: hypothetical protein A2Y62_05125 [Candidatus Fischerbacteria bacterium RBG_13_37_8]